MNQGEATSRVIAVYNKPRLMTTSGDADLLRKLSSKNMMPSKNIHTAAVCLIPRAKPANRAEA